MTRWARVNQTHNSKTEDATPWKEMAKQNDNNPKDVKKKKSKKKAPEPGKVDGASSPRPTSSKKFDESGDGKKLFKRKKFVKKNKNGYVDLEPDVEQRLQNLKKTLYKNGTTGEEIRQVIRKERRHEENKRKRELKRRCFNCRELGHNLADCPQLSKSVDQSVGLCFKCGSTEHDVSTCAVKIDGYPYAKCFICGEQGHLSRRCPDNPRGLYPNGGCCKICGSVEHFKKDCPEHQEKAKEVFVERMSTAVSADAEEFQKKEPPPKKKKKNVVKF